MSHDQLLLGALSLLSFSLSFVLLLERSKHKKTNSILNEVNLKNEDLLKVRENIFKEMEDEINEAKQEALMILERANIEADKSIKQTEEKAEGILNTSKTEAEKIAGDALRARDKASLYEKTVRAMKNQIKGYGDEYLIPNESLIDDIADEYDHEKAGKELKSLKVEIKGLIKAGEAATCNYVEEHRKTTAVNFTLDAFNGKIDTIMSKVKHDNFGKLKAKLEDSFNLVNYCGSAFKDAKITDVYFRKCLRQLELAVQVSELKKRDQEEQRRIKEQIREEDKARREYEKAMKQAEKEEKVAKKSYSEALERLSKASEEEKIKLEKLIQELETRVKEAEENGQRAISMAQQTRRGHVYIISNIGSFGEKVFKIGLTRRLEPMDRVKELGDASVPFPFDVHAMVFSEDAPALESELHRIFKSFEVNKVNSRKEFFNLDLSKIKSEVLALGYSCHWTMKALAVEYRETVQLETVAKAVDEKEVA